MPQTHSIYAVLRAQDGALYLLRFPTYAAYRQAQRDMWPVFSEPVTLTRIRREDANVIFKQRTREPDIHEPGYPDCFDCLWARP